MIQDLSSIFIWYISISAVGILFLPVTHYLYSGFIDHGYAFSKTIGILLITFTIWILASLKFISFHQITILLILGFFVVLNTWFIIKRPIIKSLHSSLKIIILEEVLFFIGLLSWSLV